MSKGFLVATRDWVQSKLNRLNRDKVAFIDTTRQLATFEVSEGTSLYTATEDCYVWGFMKSSTTLVPNIQLNYKIIYQGTNSANFSTPFSLFMKKGDVLGCRGTASNNVFTYGGTVYGLKADATNEEAYVSAGAELIEDMRNQISELNRNTEYNESVLEMVSSSTSAMRYIYKIGNTVIAPIETRATEVSFTNYLFLLPKGYRPKQALTRALRFKRIRDNYEIINSVTVTPDGGIGQGFNNDGETWDISGCIIFSIK